MDIVVALQTVCKNTQLKTVISSILILLIGTYKFLKLVFSSHPNTNNLQGLFSDAPEGAYGAFAS
jgi:hypothetical protein